MSTSVPQWRTSATTPTTTHQELPAIFGFSRLPTALSPGQYLRARLSLTMATAGELAVSRSSKASALEQRDLQGAEIVVAHGAVAGDDFSLDGSRHFAFSQNGRGRIGATQGEVASDSCRFNSGDGADMLHHAGDRNPAEPCTPSCEGAAMRKVRTFPGTKPSSTFRSDHRLLNASPVAISSMHDSAVSAITRIER